MAYDESLAERLRDLLVGISAVHETRMFGGLSFMVRGSMCVGIIGDQLCARVGVDAYEEALALPFAREMDFTKRPMKGWIYVDPPGIEDGSQLRDWLERCLRFNQTLPQK